MCHTTSCTGSYLSKDPTSAADIKKREAFEWFCLFRAQATASVKGLMPVFRRFFDSNHCSLELRAQSFSKKLAARWIHSVQWSEGSLRIPPLIGKISKLFDLSCVG